MIKGISSGRLPCLRPGCIGTVLFAAYQHNRSGYGQPEPGGVHDTGPQVVAASAASVQPFQVFEEPPVPQFLCIAWCTLLAA